MREAFDANGEIVAAAAATESTNATCPSCGRPVYLNAAKDGFTHDAPPVAPKKKPFPKMPASGRTFDLGEPNDPPQQPDQQ